MFSHVDNYSNRFNLPPQERLRWEQEVDELKMRLAHAEGKITQQADIIEKQRTALTNAEIAKNMMSKEIQRLTGRAPYEVPVWKDAHAREMRTLLGVPFPQPEFLLSQMEYHSLMNKKQEMKIPEPSQVIFSGPKTIIMWPDGSKTMVSPSEDQQIDDYAAFCAAVTKKLFGSTAKAKKFLAKVRKDQAKKAKKNVEPEVRQATEDPDWEGK